MADTKKKTDYKSTLNLPKTDFPMRAKLPQREPGFLKFWNESGVYDQIVKQHESSGKTFILHDGPPYANGNIHMGHVLNKILKDITVKFHSMRGYHSPYVPGWDCHGLPVEHRLFQELDMTKHDIDQVEFRKKAYSYAMKYVKIQSEEFQRLGIFGDWKNPYLTLTKDYEADILDSLGELYEKGYIYKDLKPVNWCASCETALAEAEVEYNEKTSPSIYVKFSLPGKVEDKSASFVVWTTTPWTLLANVAVALHPEEFYSFVDVGEEVWVMAKDLVPALMEKFELRDGRTIRTEKGARLAEEFDFLNHPFLNRESSLVTADYITMEEGSGCVHIAPGHGQDDYLTGRKYDLPVIMPVDERGRFNAETGIFEGMEVFRANKKVIMELQDNETLIISEQTEHSYPHCWRCKKPIIFRATEQWFLEIDHDSLRDKLMGSIANDVEWIPESGKDRISSMVKNRPDWCLSRQRLWGVPIPALKCKKCGEKYTSKELITKVADLTREKGSNVWFSSPVEDFIKKGLSCKNCSSGSFEKEGDILDVWFDSGVSHRAVLSPRESLSFPADLYLEGSDQHRGWFQAALITSMGMNSRAPYKKVLTHGFVVDSEGRKMSKSVGNVVSPHEVMKTYGADILRLWVFSSDYEFDIKISDEILERLADGYRKIRNTFKFLLSNLFDFDPKEHMVTRDNLTEVDRWLISRTVRLTEKVTEFYETWQYHKAYRMIYDFCVYEMSSFYLDVSKDPLYILSPHSSVRRSHQTTIYNVLNVLVKVLAPVLSFTAEEVWDKIPGIQKEKSVHMSSWPDMEEDLPSGGDADLDNKWDRLLSLRDEVLKILEIKREKKEIGSSLEARLEFFSDDVEVRSFLEGSLSSLPGLFKVSEVDLLNEPREGMHSLSGESLRAYVDKASGEKCSRCWNYRGTVGKNKDHPDICKRCREIVLERRKDGQA